MEEQKQKKTEPPPPLTTPVVAEVVKPSPPAVLQQSPNRNIASPIKEETNSRSDQQFLDEWDKVTAENKPAVE